MRPDLMQKMQRTALDIAARTFMSERNNITEYPKKHPNPEKTSNTMLHQRMVRKNRRNFSASTMSMKLPRSRSRDRIPLYEDALQKQQLAMTPKTIAGGRFKDFESLKLLPKNASQKPKSLGNTTMKTAKSTGYGGGFVKTTTNLDQSGLTNSDMISLRGGITGTSDIC